MDRRFPLEDQIEMLASALKGRVVTPHHADYDALRATNRATTTAVLRLCSGSRTPLTLPAF